MKQAFAIPGLEPKAMVQWPPLKSAFFCSLFSFFAVSLLCWENENFFFFFCSFAVLLELQWSWLLMCGQARQRYFFPPNHSLNRDTDMTTPTSDISVQVDPVQSEFLDLNPKSCGNHMDISHVSNNGLSKVPKTTNGNKQAITHHWFIWFRVHMSLPCEESCVAARADINQSQTLFCWLQQASSALTEPAQTDAEFHIRKRNVARSSKTTTQRTGENSERRKHEKRKKNFLSKVLRLFLVILSGKERFAGVA